MSIIKTPPINNISSKCFQCSCGKSYLNSTSLFTHNKLKHPSNVNLSNQPLHPINQNYTESKQKYSQLLCDKYTNLIDITDENNENNTSINSQKIIQNNEKNAKYWRSYQKIFIYLQQLHQPQNIPLNIWQQINSFKILEEFLDSNSSKKYTSSQEVNLGYALSQFLKTISLQTQPWRFQQILILFMLLLQYANDQSNSQLIISEGPVQILIEYMNPFINQYIDDFAEYLGIKGLWIINKINIHHFFMCFYQWLKWKNYTSFCITLIY